MIHIKFFDKEKCQKEYDEIQQKMCHSGNKTDVDFYKSMMLSSFFNKNLASNYALIFIYGEFVLIEYNNDNIGYKSEPDFIKDVIQRIYNANGDKFKIKRFDTNKSVRIDNKDFKKEVELSKLLSGFYKEINYIYSDNAGKQYAIVTDVMGIELNENRESKLNNYLEAKKYLNENNLNFLRSGIDELYDKSDKVYFSEKAILNSIDELVNQIKTEINE